MVAAAAWQGVSLAAVVRAALAAAAAGLGLQVARAVEECWEALVAGAAGRVAAQGAEKTGMVEGAMGLAVAVRLAGKAMVVPWVLVVMGMAASGEAAPRGPAVAVVAAMAAAAAVAAVETVEAVAVTMAAEPVVVTTGLAMGGVPGRASDLTVVLVIEEAAGAGGRRAGGGVVTWEEAVLVVVMMRAGFLAERTVDTLVAALLAVGAWEMVAQEATASLEVVAMGWAPTAMAAVVRSAVGC